MLKPRPTSTAQSSSQRRLPRSMARLTAQARQQHGQHEQAVDGVVAVGHDADRRDGEGERGEQARDRPKDTLARAHRAAATERDARQGLRQQDTEAAEAEDLRAERLNPEAERRLVDGDEAARIEGDEEEVVPAFQHAAHGGGVVEVGVAVALQLEKVAEGGEQSDQYQRPAVPGLKEVRQPSGGLRRRFTCGREPFAGGHRSQIPKD